MQGRTLTCWAETIAVYCLASSSDYVYRLHGLILWYRHDVPGGKGLDSTAICDISMITSSRAYKSIRADQRCLSGLMPLQRAWEKSKKVHGQHLGSTIIKHDFSMSLNSYLLVCGIGAIAIPLPPVRLSTV